MSLVIVSNENQAVCDHGWVHPDRARSTIKDGTHLPDFALRKPTTLKFKLTDPEQFFEQGLALIEQLEFQKAIDAFFSATTLQWAFTAAHIELGNAASAIKDYDRALRAYQDAIETAPEDPIPYYNTALTYLDMDDIEQTFTWLNTTITINPTYRPAYLQLATLSNQLKKDRRAIAYLIRAAYIEPYSTRPLIEAGKLYYQNTRYKEAIRCYHRSLRIDPWNAEAFFHLGAAQFRNGQIPQATLSLANAVNSDPTHSIARALLRVAHSSLRPRATNKPAPIQTNLFLS